MIVATHSEWALEELANIVRRSELSAMEQKSTDEGKISLHPNQVGVWLFKTEEGTSGSVVQEAKLDNEIGLFPTDFDAVSEELYKEKVRFFNRIQAIDGPCKSCETEECGPRYCSAQV